MSFSERFPSVYSIAAKVGLGARGVVYLVVATLVLWAAISPAKNDVGIDPKDAFIALEHTSLGRLGLILIAVGLLIYALWRWLTSALNDNNPTQGRRRILTRLGMIVSGAGYAFLGVVAIAVTFGANDPEGPDKTEQIARWLLGMPFGRWLLIIAGVVVAVFGFTQFWLVISDQWKENLTLTGWSERLEPVAIFGVIGRGVIFLFVACFLIIGGWRTDVDEVRGIAETLSWLRRQHYGLFLYFGAGLVIGAYGAFSLLQSRCYTLEAR